MSSKTIYWSEYELNILKTLWEISHVKDIIHHFNDKTKTQITNKALYIGLRKQINYVTHKIDLLPDEIVFMKETYSKHAINDFQKLFQEKFGKVYSNSKITKVAKQLNLVSLVRGNYWSTDDIEKLKELWPNVYNKDALQVKEIEEIFNRRLERIDAKAYHIKLKKSEEVQSKIRDEKVKIAIHRNKNILGRDICFEFAKEEALKYKSKQEMYKLDNSLYQFIRKNGYWDDLCSHMIVGDSFNYPQTFLFNCIKRLYPTATIRYNDRKAISPKEIDVYVVDHKIGFEYDGVTYHSSDEDVESDKIKNAICKDVGITLYRIKEVNKIYPENVILNSLCQFGYDTSTLDIDEIIKETFSLKYSDEMISSTVSLYTTLKDFRESEPTLYSFISRKGLSKKYLSNLETRIVDMTEQDIIDRINQCHAKSEFRERFYAYYVQMKKKSFINAQKLYDSLYSSQKTK